MPTVSGNLTPINMSDPFNFGGLWNSYIVTPQTSTFFSTSDLAGQIWAFNGVGFGYTQNIPTSGTITSLTYSINGSPVFTATGLSMPALTFMTMLGDSNLNGILAAMFAGDDTITGSTGFDNLFGYGGNDTISAGAGGDALNGGSGNDTLNGSADIDFLYGESGIDHLYGNGGADILQGGADADVLSGGDGADDLDGGTGVDVLDGGDGGDTLRSLSGADIIDGGADLDTLIFNRSTSSLAFNLNAAAMFGASASVLADGTSVRNIEHFNITTGSGDDTLTMTGLPPSTGYGGNHFDGGAGFDQIIADFSAATLAVGAYLTWANIEQLNIQGGSADDTLFGGAGMDTLIGNGGNDRLDGGASENYISGGDGNDFLSGGSGTMLGGADNDTMTVYLLSNLQTYTIDGGTGHDTLNLTIVDPAGVAFRIGVNATTAGVEDITFTAGPGADTLYIDHPGLDPLNPTGAFIFNANDGNDRLVVDLSSAIGTLFVYQSNLTIGTQLSLYYTGVELFELYAGVGNDNLSGGANRDIFYGGAGNDTIDGGEGDDDLYGGIGADTLRGGTGTNTLAGGDDNDIIYSTSFDVIDGGAGDDLLYINHEYYQNNITFDSGGEAVSADGTIIRNVERFDISTGYGDDVLTIIGPLTGENRWNAFEDWVLYPLDPWDPFSPIVFEPAVEYDRLVIDFSTWTTGETVHFESYYFIGEGWSLTTSGVDQFWLTGTSGDDYMWSGGRQGSRLIGGDGNDSLRGYYGDNYLDGGNGNDTIIGGEGNDTILAGAGNDDLNSNFGTDIVDGGSGIDRTTYSFRASTDATWHRNIDGTWSVSLSLYAPDNDTLTSVEVLDFTDRDVVLDNAQQTFSGDGASDVLWRNTSGLIATWSMLGAAQTGGAVVGNVGAEWTISGTGDFSADGRDDILWRRDDGLVFIWNDASSTAGVFVASAGTAWDIAGVGDFNFDGRDDFLWRNDATGQVAVWTMNGAAVATQNVIADAGAEWSVQAAADFDGDGRDDILWRRDDGVVYMWETNGAALTDTAFAGSVGNEWQIAGAGDFNGDGRADILWQRDDGLMAIWHMDGATTLSSAVIGGVGTTWNVADVGDYNADGKDDILWRNDDGLVAVWTMNGFTVLGTGVTGSVGNDWVIIGSG
jgi:Ca2+-binding RTX toxin-like protein